MTKWIDNIWLQPMLLPSHCVKSLSFAASSPASIHLAGLLQQITVPSMFKTPIFGSYVQLVTMMNWNNPNTCIAGKDLICIEYHFHTKVKTFLKWLKVQTLHHTININDCMPSTFLAQSTGLPKLWSSMVLHNWICNGQLYWDPSSFLSHSMII